MVNQLGVVVAFRAKYPTPLGDRHAAFLVEVARATRALLLRKESGAHVRLPNGVGVAQDILIFDAEGVDILRDAEGAAEPTWQEKGPIFGEYVDVGEPDDEPDDEPGDLASKVAALERRVHRLETGSYRLVVE